MIIEVNNETEMRNFGERLGRLLAGGEVIELIGDVGAGKTSLTKGIAVGLGIEDDVQSPTFTISREYQARDGLRLAHYDFYRISNAGIMADELHETIGDKKTITVVEWSGVVADVLPRKRMSVHIAPTTATARTLTLAGLGDKEDGLR